MTATATDPRYPIGKFEPQAFSEKLKQQWLTDLSFLPKDVEVAIENLDEHQLETPYREGGWKINQLVHHIADSHMNGFIRCKLALTEDAPTIKPYQQDAWVNTDDVITEPINVSITLLYALHRKWVSLLQNVPEEKWQQCKVFHPEHEKYFTLWNLLGTYAWHGRHHVAHIKNAKGK